GDSGNAHVGTEHVGTGVHARPLERSSTGADTSSIDADSSSGAPLRRTGVDARPHTAGSEPDVLVMTAPPIPRTVALTLYGDLDISILNEMPPGRTPIVTRRVGDERSEEVWQFVRKQVAGGHRTYVVYSVIEE